MIFSDVPGSTVSRAWNQISILYSNVFRIRALSKENQFRISLGIGFTDVDSIPVIISRKTEYIQQAVWQEMRVRLSKDYEGQQLYIFARISDVQWGQRGPVQFALREGDKMIFDGSSAVDNLKAEEVTQELPSAIALNSVPAANTAVVVAADKRRKSGFIHNRLSSPIFVYFGEFPAPGTLARDFATARVPSGARIDFPKLYTGKISVDMKGQFTPDTSLVACVQYLGAPIE